jgi:hypothetical protein
MSDVLCTFPGKYGDILWSLPTVREISRLTGGPVDFFVMPYYDNMKELFECQTYIDKTGSFKEWLRKGSDYGDQPWQPPKHLEEPYRQHWHLGYRAHPGVSAPEMPLVHFTAFQQGIQLHQPVVPFIEVDDDLDFAIMDRHMEAMRQNRIVSYAFNDQYQRQKNIFFQDLWKAMMGTGVEFLNLNMVGWKEAAWMIKSSFVYVGDRSACWVLATGMGKKTITFEPHPMRHIRSRLGRVFGCPYGQEMPLPFGLPPAECAKAAASFILRAKEEENAKYDTVGV